jgi:hypothetical protein
LNIQSYFVMQSIHREDAKGAKIKLIQACIL